MPGSWFLSGVGGAWTPGSPLYGGGGGAGEWNWDTQGPFPAHPDHISQQPPRRRDVIRQRHHVPPHNAVVLKPPPIAPYSPL